MAVLHILKGTNQGQRLPLGQDRTILGRNRDCHVVIEFPAVSREHANILRVNGKFYIEDCGSRNGTFVNNQKIEGRTPLKENDRIKICDFLCTFHEAAGAAAPAALKPLPASLRPDEPDLEEPTAETTATVEATLARMSSSQLLESQPAEKLTALIEILGNLSKTLELDTLLPRIADSLFDLFRQADRCFLILSQEGPPKLLPKLIKTRRAGGESNSRFSRSIVEQCLKTGQGLLSEDASTDSRFSQAQSIADFRIRSVMCGPLTSSDGKAFGVIQLDTQDRTKKFTQEDLKLLVAVANQAAVAFANVQMHDDLVVRDRFQRDMQLASQVQRGFLPQALPEIAGYEFFAAYESAQQIGGDYYDFVSLPSKQLAILLGDVAGKGVPAALLMAKLSSEARFAVLTEPGPGPAITKLNNLLSQAGLMDRFVTFAGTFLDPANHRVTIVNAGHQVPLLFKPGATDVNNAVSDEESGLPLGVMEDFEYGAVSVDLQPGEIVLIFTDGITDAMSVKGEAFQMKGLRDAIDAARATGEPISPARLGDAIIKAVKDHASGRSPHDDIALVCFGRIE
jgi:serine phosphatase RsbU (regulator of sigma subunit)/pSer/pThr/pTyr-binding forkhead associated (FHA) protein